MTQNLSVEQMTVQEEFALCLKRIETHAKELTFWVFFSNVLLMITFVWFLELLNTNVSQEVDHIISIVLSTVTLISFMVTGVLGCHLIRCSLNEVKRLFNRITF